MMGAVAKNSKQFFHLSGEYFDSQGRGMLQLQGPMEMFTGPKLASEITCSIAFWAAIWSSNSTSLVKCEGIKPANLVCQETR